MSAGADPEPDAGGPSRQPTEPRRDRTGTYNTRKLMPNYHLFNFRKAWQFLLRKIIKDQDQRPDMDRQYTRKLVPNSQNLKVVFC